MNIGENERAQHVYERLGFRKVRTMKKQLKTFLTILLAIVLWPLGLFALYDWLKKRWQMRQRQQRVAALLDGREITAVLQTAPYSYGHFQGENGYRIWDERIENGFVGFAATPQEAELWIVEHYLSESN
ncbi:hypothetical protein [Candidatus Leptofilum sp.]|uniref:hypothetical protein n=1 Tax=Candidatus Leptofilum sp. TaxID=3241576 RepID=UPI003B59B33C